MDNYTNETIQKINEIQFPLIESFIKSREISKLERLKQILPITMKELRNLRVNNYHNEIHDLIKIYCEHTNFEVSPSNIEYKLKDNAEEILNNTVRGKARMASLEFLSKMESKLSGILKERTVKSVELLESVLFTSTIKIIIDENNYFIMENTTEIARSCRGTMFNRFPCRFTVAIKDGKSMKKLSEGKMKNEY